MKKGLGISVAIIISGVALLFINKMLTANSVPEGWYISSLRQPLMIFTYVLVIVGVASLAYNILKKPQGRE